MKCTKLTHYCVNFCFLQKYKKTKIFFKLSDDEQLLGDFVPRLL